MSYSDFIKLIRLNHILKNLAILLPFIFSTKHININYIIDFIFVFIAFTLASSIVYIFNDLCDIEEDSKHPVKKNRPIASGSVKWKTALNVLLILFILLIVAEISLLKFYGLFLINLYILLNAIYSIYLKRVFFIGSLFVSIIFNIRVLIGYFIIDEPFDISFLLFNLTLSVIVSLTKHIQKSEYRGIIEALYYILSPVCIIFFSIFALRQNVYLNITVPFIMIGIIRFYNIIFDKNTLLIPFEIFLNDRVLLKLVLTFNLVSLILMRLL